ncbi:hypothetical protein [Bacillus sp. SG-1]|uniref:hypothetical protein n=1 Tax=Bacillus sp. SG-1 TaxID=161544 RepID=UPI00015449BA|nr:hypothetical protein [Bacillus sp. SG-1]EDL63969.1 RNA polymerase sigma-D factor [Bacillus sp. SG-1]
MMAGSLFWNFAFSIAGFSLYFFLSFQTGSPRDVLTGSFLAAGSFFILMFGIRVLIQMGMAVPEAEEGNAEDENRTHRKNINETKLGESKQYNEEEMAAVIRTLLKDE